MPRPKKVEGLSDIQRLALIAVHRPEALTDSEIRLLGESAIAPAPKQRRKRRKRRKKRTAKVAKKASKKKLKKIPLALEKKMVVKLNRQRKAKGKAYSAFVPGAESVG